jgi:hypothetical protein
MKHGFTRSGIAHRRRQQRQEHAIRRVIVCQQFLVAANAHRGRDVVGFGFADQRV